MQPVIAAFEPFGLVWRGPNRLAVLMLLTALLLWHDGLVALAQSSHDLEVRAAFSARVRGHGEELERDRRHGRAHILELIEAERLEQLADIMLDPEDAGSGQLSSRYYYKLLRAAVKADRPCLPRSETCDAASLVRATLDNKSYARCMVDHLDVELIARIANLRRLAAKIRVTPPTLMDRIEYNALSTDVKNSACGPGDPAALVLPIPLKVEWGKQCTTDAQETKLYQPAVASVLREDKRRGLQAFCTGTLIAPNAVLTAGHCICATKARGDPNGAFYASADNCANGAFWHRGQLVSPMDPALLSVYFQHSGVHEVERVVLHERYSWLSTLPRADLAILILKKSVTGIEPATVDNIGAARRPAVGRSVGYGWSNPIDSQGRPTSPFVVQEQTGIKFVSRVAPTGCYSVEAWHKLVCWDYRTTLGTERGGSTCHGDSGGPLFMPVGKSTFLAGVTTAGTGCQPGARAYSMEVFQFHPWIERALAAFPPRSTGPARSKPTQAGCKFCPFCGDLDAGQLSSESIVPIVGKKTRTLHVGVNCTPDVLPWRIGLSRKTPEANDFEAQPICAGNRVSTVAACEARVEDGETWRVEVKGAPTRDCQIVATTFE